MEHDNSPNKCEPEFTHLLVILNKQLLDIIPILKRVAEGQGQMNENYDILELTLRRSLFSLGILPLTCTAAITIN